MENRPTVPPPPGVRGTVPEDWLEALGSIRGIAHELRNSTASIGLALHALSQGGEVQSEAGRQRVRIAERELARIEALLGSLDQHAALFRRKAPAPLEEAAAGASSKSP